MKPRGGTDLREGDRGEEREDGEGLHGSGLKRVDGFFESTTTGRVKKRERLWGADVTVKK